MDQVSLLRDRIPLAMVRDRHRVSQRLRSIRQAQRAGKPIDRALARLGEELDQSIELHERRRAKKPEPRYDVSLPIVARMPDVAAAIRDHAVVIVCGETGSGKSTQLPKICLDLGRGQAGMIGHTQPRRIAARSVAARVAEELGSPVGHDVGFKVRFSDVTQDSTYIKLMTDGILLAETQNDRFLNQYDTLIIDEAHERSLNIDFLLGYIQRLLPKRPDLKLIITSATIDAERFSQHFLLPNSGQPAPVVEVSGRTYPVEIRYQPLASEDPDDADLDAQQGIIRGIEELACDGNGDVLVFLPTERDIRETSKALRSWGSSRPDNQTEVLPLYARLSTREQNRVFQPHKRRRIVLATNVAESSLTVPQIRYVIDTGTARLSRYSPRRKVQRLPIEAVSRASADQRAGRCGRIGPGICIRLYDEADYLSRDRYTTPEIRRTNLASVILQTKALRLGAIEEFPFLDPPTSDAIRDGYRTLFELGALDHQRRLTDLGRQLARLPVDPRIGRMILAAVDEGCLHDVLIIAAALEVQDPRERPVDKQQAADECHSQFADPNSDFLSYLKLWDFYHRLRENKALSRSQLRKACRQNFLSFNRIREWLDIHRQLKQSVGDAKLVMSQRSQAVPSQRKDQTNRVRGARTRSSNDADTADFSGSQISRERYAAIHRALLTGLMSNIAQLGDAHQYNGAGGNTLYLWPGSGVFDKRPKWLMAAELVETTRSFARTVARIEPAWIEPLAEHLVKRSYSDPHWSRRNGAAMAYEKVSLFGLAIVPRRRVRYGPIDPVVSRQLLIRHGLAEGQYTKHCKFLTHNRRLVEEIEGQATCLRRSDWFVGEQRQIDFYEERIPPDVCDGARLQQWIRQQLEGDDRSLFMRREDLLEEAPPEAIADEFPKQLSVGETQLPLEYRFEPGNQDDGITVTIPQAAVGQLQPGRLGWLVPGLLDQKLVALIRSLPKSLRRNFVPAPDTARRAVARLRFGEGPFLDTVARALQQISGERVTAQDFQLDKLPPHLQMNVRVVDDEGQVVSRSRDLSQLQGDVAAASPTTLGELIHPDWHLDGLTTWHGDLPEQVSIPRGGITLTAYPMLVDTGGDVSLRLAATPEQAARQTHGGLRRLCYLDQRQELRSQVKWMPRLDQLKLYAATLDGAARLEEDLALVLADRAYLEQASPVRTAADFQQLLLRGRKRIPLAVQSLTQLVGPLLEAYHQAAVRIEEATSPGFQSAVGDMRHQLARLLSAGFLVDVPWNWLQHFPRYLRAVGIRLEKLTSNLPRDQQHQREIEHLWDRYEAHAAELAERGAVDARLDEFRWMMEEYRVSLFAQELGTSQSVSGKRLEKQWAKVIAGS